MEKVRERGSKREKERMKNNSISPEFLYHFDDFENDKERWRKRGRKIKKEKERGRKTKKETGR